MTLASAYVLYYQSVSNCKFNYFFSFLISISISIYFLFLNSELGISIDVICNCYKLLHDVTWYHISVIYYKT